jgi:hypothetical protein
MKKIELEVLGLTYSGHAHPTYILVLKEKNGPKRLPIVIGPYEAQAIALKLDELQPKRPITHDLMYNVLKTLGIELVEVTILKVEEDIFFGEVVLRRLTDGQEFRIDSRPSDAIALALRFGCPIYATEQVMNLAAIEVEDRPAETTQSEQEKHIDHLTEEQSTEELLKKLSLNQLEEMMQRAIEREDYELASKIRDEIKRRKGEI